MDSQPLPLMTECRLLLATLALALGDTASAAQIAGQPETKPTLVVAIAVDQFSADLFNEYRPLYRYGLKRLASGVVFPAGYQSHGATETCPGHSTILTGSRPSRTGIIANNWMDPMRIRAGKDGKPDNTVYCVEDETAPGTHSTSYVVSARHLRVPAMGDRMKEATPASRVVAIAGKDRSAVLMGGHHPDLALWWDGIVFSTYRNSPARLPRALPRINAAVTDEIAHPAMLSVPAQCRNREESIVISDKLTVGTLLPRKAGEATAWRSTPLLDTKTMDLVLATVDEMQLGKGPATDLLAISLSATDYVGHAFGTSGVEMCTQILALDATLDRLFTALDKAGIPYVAALTADHGGHDVVERNVRRGFPQIERVDGALHPDKMGPRIAQQLGLDGTALLGETASGDLYVNGLVPPARRAEVLAASVDAYRVHRQVAAVFTHAQLLATPTPGPNVDEWTLLERARASFDPERSGDLVVMLNENVSSVPPNIANTIAGHGSPYNRDRRVPILFWWKGIKPFEQPNSVETVDILPTLASLIDLAVPPSEIDGRCLDLLPSGETNCPTVFGR
jgi:hypothetical protein